MVDPGNFYSPAINILQRSPGHGIKKLKIFSDSPLDNGKTGIILGFT